MSSRPDIHIRASFFTLHCDIFHLDIISSLFFLYHIPPLVIFVLCLFLSSLITRHYPCFTLGGGLSHVTAWRIVTSFPIIHPRGSGSEMLFWEVVLLMRIHVTFVCGEGLIIWVCIFMGVHSLLIRVCAKKKEKKIAHCSFYYSPLGMCMDVLVCFIRFMC